MVKQTQIEALEKQIATGKLKTDKAKILKFIQDNPKVSRIDIRDGLGMHEYTVGGRLSDLEDLGLIETAHNTKEQRGSKQSLYSAVNSDWRQSQLRIERDKQKAIKWINKGLKDYSKHLTNEAKQGLNNSLLNLDLPF